MTMWARCLHANLTPRTTAEVTGGFFANAKKVTVAEGQLLRLVMR